MAFKPCLAGPLRRLHVRQVVVQVERKSNDIPAQRGLNIARFQVLLKFLSRPRAPARLDANDIGAASARRRADGRSHVDEAAR